MTPIQRQETGFKILSKTIKNTLIETIGNSLYWNKDVSSPGEIRTPVGGSKALYPCPLDDRASALLKADFIL